MRRQGGRGHRQCVVTMRRQRQREMSYPSCGCPVYNIYIYTHTLSHIDIYGFTVYKYICLSLNLNVFSQAK